jgi:hypothetical protein
MTELAGIHRCGAQRRLQRLFFRQAPIDRSGLRAIDLKWKFCT